MHKCPSEAAAARGASPGRYCFARTGRLCHSNPTGLDNCYRPTPVVFPCPPFSDGGFHCGSSTPISAIPLQVNAEN